MTKNAHTGQTRRMRVACQLCDFNNRDRYVDGHVPDAVVKMEGVRICARHLRLIHAIARAAGVSTKHLPSLKLAAKAAA